MRGVNSKFCNIVFIKSLSFIKFNSINWFGNFLIICEKSFPKVKWVKFIGKLSTD